MTTTNKTETLFVPHGATLEVYDPTRSGLVVLTSTGKQMLPIWTDGNRLHSLTRKRHHVLYNPTSFVEVGWEWGYQMLTGPGWGWWRKATAITSAIVKGGGGVVSTTMGGGAVRLTALVRKDDLANLAPKLLAIGTSPVPKFQDILEGVGLAADVAQYVVPTTRESQAKIIWPYRSWPTVPATSIEDGEFTAKWEGERVFIRYNGSTSHDNVVAVVPGKWFDHSGGTVEVRVGGYMERGEYPNREVSPEPIIIEVAKYEPPVEQYSGGGYGGQGGYCSSTGSAASAEE